MSRPAPAARVRATDLYDLAVCPHRIALDRRLPREARTPPSAATARLLAHGLALEAEVAGALGYPQPEYPPGDFAEGARRTRELLEAGASGVYQGVLFDGRHLAIPDLLRRVDGASALGPFHYEPGDVKAGRTPRADQVLQVAYGGLLLARLQGRAPSHGFLVLGDRREERFPLGELQHVLASAVAQVEAIVDGGGETFPFLGPGCAGCRWRGVCVPELAASARTESTPWRDRTRWRVRVIPSISERSPRATRPGMQVSRQRQPEQPGPRKGKVSPRPSAIASTCATAEASTCFSSASGKRSSRRSPSTRKPCDGGRPCSSPSSRPPYATCSTWSARGVSPAFTSPGS